MTDFVIRATERYVFGFTDVRCFGEVGTQDRPFAHLSWAANTIFPTEAAARGYDMTTFRGQVAGIVGSIGGERL